jgi:hypothetical protein
MAATSRNSEPGLAECREGTGREEARSRSKVQCWNCQEYGHYQSDCKKPRRRRSEPEKHTKYGSDGSEEEQEDRDHNEEGSTRRNSSVAEKALSIKKYVFSLRAVKGSDDVLNNEDEEDRMNRSPRSKVRRRAQWGKRTSKKMQPANGVRNAIDNCNRGDGTSNDPVRREAVVLW